MGTRNLTMVVKDGKTVVAQYGQWDGYPEGQGVTALEFLRGMDETAFRAALDRCQFITMDDIKAAYEKVGAGGKDWINDAEAKAFNRIYPLLTRDHGAEILSLIMAADEPRLKDSSSFAGDSLFCEFAYVVDLDKRTFEVYRGFNKQPVPAGERFAAAERDKNADGSISEYYPIRHHVTFSLDALPTNDDFLKAANPPDEEEEAA